MGVKAAECCLEIVKFFDFVQRLYSSFSASIHWQSVLKSAFGKYHVVVKHLSGMILSAHFNRGVQYVHWVMHTFIMVKVGGKRNTHKACKKQVNFSKTAGEFFKVGGNNNFRETKGNVLKTGKIGEKFEMCGR